MSYAKIAALTLLAMLAFAANSLLCRIALKNTEIDAATFTSIRLISGALTLFLVVQLRRGVQSGSGSWLSAFALFVYAAGFSFAYVTLPASTGALMLFGAVQATMILYGAWTGDRLRALQYIGLAAAFSGLLALFLPKLTAPNPSGAFLMLSAGFAWGVYSLRGRKAGDPIKVTAGNFLRAAPIAVVLGAFASLFGQTSFDSKGALCAVCSGAVTSGIGYVIWYTALPSLKPANAAIVQLSVPILTSLGGILFLSEPLTLNLVIASVAVLGGIALVNFGKDVKTSQPSIIKHRSGV